MSPARAKFSQAYACCKETGFLCSGFLSSDTAHCMYRGHQPSSWCPMETGQLEFFFVLFAQIQSMTNCFLHWKRGENMSPGKVLQRLSRLLGIYGFTEVSVSIFHFKKEPSGHRNPIFKQVAAAQYSDWIFGTTFSFGTIDRDSFQMTLKGC